MVQIIGKKYVIFIEFYMKEDNFVRLEEK